MQLQLFIFVEQSKQTQKLIKMKRNLINGIVLGLAVLFASCSKNHDDPGTGTSGSTKLSAKVEGATFQARTTGALLGNDNTLGITATDANDNTISIYAPAREGSFTDKDNAGGDYIDKDGKLWMSTFNGSTSTTITITKYNASTKKVSGTFSFTAEAVGTSNATGTKTITNGTFTDISVL